MASRQSFASVVRSFGIAALLVMAACTAVPQQEFKAYTDAFAEVKSVSEQILVDMETAEKMVAKIRGDRNPPAAVGAPYRKDVDLLALATPKEDQATKRHRALEAVDSFNNVLVALAAGKKPEEIQSSVDSLIGGLKNVAALTGQTLPIPAPVGKLAATAIELLEKAQNRQQFDAGLRAAAPVIDEFLVLLTKDAQSIFVNAVKFTDLATEHERDRVTDYYVQMKQVASAHKEPGAGDLKTGRDSLEKKLEKALRQVGHTAEKGFNAKLPISAAGKTFDAMALSQLEQTYGLMEAAAQKYSALVEKQNAYHELVMSYGRMLASTRRTLQTVRTALDRPADIRAQALELVGFAFDVKRKLEALRETRQAASGR
jgi:hypothetical protein